MKSIKIVCAIILSIVAIFSVFVVGKLASSGFPVKAYVLGGELDFISKVEPTLSEKRSFTIDLDQPEEAFHHILVAKTIDPEKNDVKYDLYTPRHLIANYTPHMEQHEDSFLQIVNVAFAQSVSSCNHQDIICGHYTDNNGNQGSGCWCSP